MSLRIAASLVRPIVAVVLLWALLTPVSAAAQATGTVAGRVADSTGAALPGAQVSIRSLSVRTATNAQGEFILQAVTVGTHELEVEYLGFRTVTQSVTVSATQRASVAVVLVPAISVEETVTASATPIRDGQARALNQQRTADNIGNVVSADAIGRFPDPNIAEALQRTPGIAIARDQGEGRYINVRGAPSEFSQVSINGVSLPAPSPTTRAMDLDTIPSDIVNQIEVSKSLRPNMDADSIAGAVNIVTSSPFDFSGLRINASGGGSYNDFGGTNDSRGSLLVSNLFGRDRQFGALVSFSYSKTRRQLDNVESAWQALARPEGGEVMGVTENLFKDYDTRRERLAATAVLEWRATPTDRYFVNGSFARFTDDEFRNRLGIQWADGVLVAGATDTAATFRNVRLSKQFRHRVQRNDVGSLSVGGRHFFSRGIADYTASFSRAEQTYPSRNELLYRTGANIQLSYDYSGNPDQPTFSLFSTNQHLDLTRYSFRENTFRTNNTLEDEISFAANLEMMGRLFGTSATHMFGVKFRGKDKTADEDRWRDRRTTSAPPNTMASYIGTEASANFGYVLGNKFDSTAVRAYLDAAKATSEPRVPESRTADYEVGEDILAAYGSTRLKLGKADLLVGLRLEHTALDSKAVGYNVDTGQFSDRTADNSYTNLFPGATLRYAFSDKAIGRLAVTRAINRPNYVSLVPRLSQDDETTRVLVTSGNPDLKPTLATNLDGSIEYYMAPIGILSAGVFYKSLSDYRFDLTLAGTFDGRPALITRPENAPDGRIAGAEFAWQQQFTMLPGWMDGFGAFANYTYTNAHMNLGRTYQGRSRFPLTGQSKHNSNAGVFYEKSGFNMRLSYTDRSNQLTEINADDARFDLYWAPRSQVDLTSSYQITRMWETYFEGKNLTNTAGIRYFGDRKRVYEYEKFGYTLFLGVRFKR
jgi:TonB-dependent receptor